MTQSRTRRTNETNNGWTRTRLPALLLAVAGRQEAQLLDAGVSPGVVAAVDDINRDERDQVLGRRS